MADDKSEFSKEGWFRGWGVVFKARKIMEALIPLPCTDYRDIHGNCDAIPCPSVDGEDPLCRTRRLLAEQLALAMQVNKYDATNPLFYDLPPGALDLIREAREKTGKELFPPLPSPPRGKE